MISFNGTLNKLILTWYLLIPFLATKYISIVLKQSFLDPSILITLQYEGSISKVEKIFLVLVRPAGHSGESYDIAPYYHSISETHH